MDLNVHGTDCEMESQPGGGAQALRRIRLHQIPGSAASDLRSLCSSGPCGQGMSREGRIVPRGEDLQFTSSGLRHLKWALAKRPFQAIL